MADEVSQKVIEELIKKLESLVEAQKRLGIVRGGTFTDEDLDRARAFSLAISTINDDISKQISNVDDLAKFLESKLGRKLVKTRSEFKTLSTNLQEVTSEFQKATQQAGDFGKGLASALKGVVGVSKGASQSLTGQFVGLSSKLAEGTTTIKREFQSFFQDVTNSGDDFATATLQKLQEFGVLAFGLALDLDAMRAAMNLATLSSDTFADVATEALNGNIRLGASFEDAGEAAIMLSRFVHEAGNATQSYSRDLADISVKMKVLGADMNKVGEILAFYQNFY